MATNSDALIYEIIFFEVFLLHFWNLHQILNILQKKITLIAYVILKLETANDVLVIWLCWRVPTMPEICTTILLSYFFTNLNAIKKNTKIFLSFFCCILEIYIKFWTIWKTKMAPIAHVFLKLQTAKDSVS